MAPTHLMQDARMRGTYELTPDSHHRHEAWWQWVPNAAYTITSMPSKSTPPTHNTAFQTCPDLTPCFSIVAAGDWFEVEIDTKSTTSARV